MKMLVVGAVGVLALQVLVAPAVDPASSQTHDDGPGGPSRNGEGVGTAPVDRKPQHAPGTREPWREPWYRKWFGG